MARFIEGNELNLELEKLFTNAERMIILISPFIKLHDRYISALRTQKENHNLEIIIVFGKNEEDPSKSMKAEDLSFFKEFPNVQIRYEKRLHAKYYSNEKCAILTSMNLHRYSNDNNIEAGILTKTASMVGNIANKVITGEADFDGQAWDYFRKVIDQSQLIFHKEPQYESTMLGLSKKFIKSNIEVNLLSEFFTNKTSFERAPSFSEKRTEKNYYQSESQNPKGYCIRTGRQIEFNLEKPLSYEAYKKWNEFADENYPEKFCHFSGEQSFGETSVSRPILNKNWKKAKQQFDFK